MSVRDINACLSWYKSAVVAIVSILLFTSASSCGAAQRMPHSRREMPSQPKVLHIVAVNDMHAALEPFGRFAFMVDSLRQLYPSLLLVSAGDNQTGNPVNDQYPSPGSPMIQLMNHLKFDICAVGNHEFDTGQAQMQRLLEEATFPFICANMSRTNGTSFPGVYPYRYVTTKDGIKVAFTSLLSINQVGIPDSHPKHLKGLAFTDPLSMASDYLHLRDSADLLIYLTHLGYGGDRAVANLVPHGAIPLIIGGHSHTVLSRGERFNGTLITQAGSRLKYLTHIVVTIAPDGEVTLRSELLPIDLNGTKNSVVEEMVQVFVNNPMLHEVIAHNPHKISSGRRVGYLMADALREQTNSDIALLNPGGVRIDSLPAGEVKVNDVFRMDPFGNEIIELELLGSELKNMLIAAYPFDHNTPLIPSGAHLTYYVDKSTGKLLDVDIAWDNGRPFDDKQHYCVMVSSYMNSVYKYDHTDLGVSLHRTTADNMIEYLRALGTLRDYRSTRRSTIVRK